MNKKDQTIIDFFPSSFWKEMFGEKKFTPQFNKNWNHLMPVVEVLEENFDDLYIDISGKECSIKYGGHYSETSCDMTNCDYETWSNYNTKIETVYRAILSFIEYCNGSNIKFPTQ